MLMPVTLRSALVASWPSMCRRWHDSPGRHRSATGSTYGRLVPPAPDVRRALFGRWVKRALEHASATLGINVAQVVVAAGVDERSRARLSRSTVYRWLRGDWEEDPKAAQVEAFCDAIGVSPTEPFRILWPGRTSRPVEPDPLPTHPDLDRLARRLADPNVSDQDKWLITETLRLLANRRADRGPGAGDASRTG